MEKMRFSVLFFVLSIYLCARAAEGDVSFSLLGATGDTYKKFIKDLRADLPVNPKEVYNIPVLLPTVSEAKRYILVDLTNYNSETITLAIDVLNVYVVAYRTRNRSFYFRDEPAAAIKKLFPGTDPQELPYTGNYISLETAAKARRENIDLGFSPLGSAITTLYYYDATAAPAAFIVIIQMVSEAARFKYIAQKVSDFVGKEFKPDPAIISLENKWSDLSEQIQIAQTRNGQFARPVELRTVGNNPILVTNVTSPVVKGVALLLYYKVSSATTDNSASTKLPGLIRMPAAAISEHGSGTVAMIQPSHGHTGRKSIDNGRFRLMGKLIPRDNQGDYAWIKF